MDEPHSQAADLVNKIGADYLPGLLGLKFTDFGDGWVEAEVEIRKA
ncbi:MAG: hypothetical protein GXP06_10620 [Alphaproteobacteria bacterium]|nr:hypothetical protein [Alphaproteobacteria bacterium]